MPPGILFDLDETLIDRADSIKKYAGMLYEDLGDALAVHRDGFVSEFLRLDGNGYASRAVLFEDLASYIDHPDVNAGTLAAHFSANAWTRPTLMPGAERCLRRLRNTGLPLGIVTNGSAVSQRKKLAGTGLERLVDHVVISEEFGAKKPAASIFLAACEELRIHPSASWFVGDNPAVDIAGANALGFRTIWLERSVAWPADLLTCYTCAVTSLEDAVDALLPTRHERL